MTRLGDLTTGDLGRGLLLLLPLGFALPITLSALSLASALSSCEPSAFFLPWLLSAAGKPNVIYILADDLGYGDLSCYGQKKFKTPHIDRLASEGLKFTAHYSGNTVCTPSRAVLMTGMHSGRCYVRGNLRGEAGAALDEKMTVLPEVFKAAGYRTGAFGKWGLGNTHLKGAPSPLNHGFDEFYGWKSQTIAHTYYPTTYVHNGRELPLKQGTYLHTPMMEQARAFVRGSVQAKQPFFCYIPTAIPHAAMHAPKELHEKWRKVFPQFDKKIGKYGAGGEPCPDVVNPIAGFAAMMEHLDNEIGALLKLLDELVHRAASTARRSRYPNAPSSPQTRRSDSPHPDTAPRLHRICRSSCRIAEIPCAISRAAPLAHASPRAGWLWGCSRKTAASPARCRAQTPAPVPSSACADTCPASAATHGRCARRWWDNRCAQWSGFSSRKTHRTRGSTD